MTTKKAGGPVTEAGKQIVSKNALKHGATSKRLLNSKDDALYTKLVEELTAHYVSSNPLAKFQIERIARLNVQLQRIQDAIDANFEISHLEAKDAGDLLNPEYGLNKVSSEPGSSPRYEITLIPQSQHSEITKRNYINLATELIDNNFSAIITHEGFLKKCPKFCDYIFQESQLENMTIPNFIDAKFYRSDTSWDAFLKKQKEGNKIHNPQLHAPPLAGITKEQAIFNTTLGEIRSAAKWLVEEKELILTYNQRVAEHKRLKEIKLIAKIPDLVKLDSLMRYQTSLQRQISTAMGELIAITSI